MAHSINAIIGREKDIKSFCTNWVHAKCKELAQGFWLIRVDSALIDDINELANAKCTYPFDELYYLTNSLSELLKESSRNTKLAYLETDYFGGVGTQAAILYQNESIAAGPLTTEDKWDNNNGFFQIPSGDRAINVILEKMGVSCMHESDEFESIKLSWER